MNIISIDPSKACTGIFSKVANIERSFSISHGYNVSQETALQNIYHNFTRELKNPYQLGLIEGYYLANPRGMLLLPEIVGVIKLCFAHALVPLVSVNVATWKSIVKIKIDKNKKKKEYLEAIRVKYGKDFSIVDEADAFLIYQAAKVIAKSTKQMTPGAMKIRKQLETVINQYKQGELNE